MRSSSMVIRLVKSEGICYIFIIFFIIFLFCCIMFGIIIIVMKKNMSSVSMNSGSICYFRFY